MESMEGRQMRMRKKRRKEWGRREEGFERRPYWWMIRGREGGRERWMN